MIEGHFEPAEALDYTERTDYDQPLPPAIQAMLDKIPCVSSEAFRQCNLNLHPIVAAGLAFRSDLLEDEAEELEPSLTPQQRGLAASSRIIEADMVRLNLRIVRNVLFGPLRPYTIRKIGAARRLRELDEVPFLDAEDLWQEGVIALHGAVRSWDPEAATLGTHAKNRIVAALSHHLPRGATIRPNQKAAHIQYAVDKGDIFGFPVDPSLSPDLTQPISLASAEATFLDTDAEPFGEDPDIDERLVAVEPEGIEDIGVLELLDYLSPEARSIVTARLNSPTHMPQTFREVAAQLGTATYEEVHNEYTRAIGLLRHSSRHDFEAPVPLGRLHVNFDKMTTSYREWMNDFLDRLFVYLQDQRREGRQGSFAMFLAQEGFDYERPVFSSILEVGGLSDIWDGEPAMNGLPPRVSLTDIGVRAVLKHMLQGRYEAGAPALEAKLDRMIAHRNPQWQLAQAKNWPARKPRKKPKTSFGPRALAQG